MIPAMLIEITQRRALRKPGRRSDVPDRIDVLICCTATVQGACG